MKLEINVPVSGLDLASLLEGEQGAVPLPKQRTKLHHSSKGWSFDRLRADANRQGHPGAGGNQPRAGTLVRHEDQQLD